VKLPDQTDREIRFDIVVFNYEHIVSLTDYFDKIRNFHADRDRLLVLDCSLNHAAEKQRVEEFARRRGWNFGREVQVIKRKNWGIDQGARVDYLSWLHETKNRPRYIWQFQEHYLDLVSPWSIWQADSPMPAGEIKNDTIPDSLEIDLDECERIYEHNPKVGVIYADRGKLGIMGHQNGTESFYAGGANFSVRTSDALSAFRPDILDSYRAIYDGTYEWALFMELDIGRQLTRADREWHDLVTHNRFCDASALRKLETEKQISMHQSAEPFYGPLYQRYERRFNAVLAESAPRRRLHARLSLWYVDLLASGSRGRLKRVLNSLGLALLAKRMRHYVAVVLRQE
jgi:hypothetical protein